MATVIVLTSGTSWRVPDDCTSLDKIECLGAGGNGGVGAALTGASAGQSGQYISTTALSVTPGALIQYQVGVPSATQSATSASATWFNGTQALTGSATIGCLGGAPGVAGGSVPSGMVTGYFPGGTVAANSGRAPAAGGSMVGASGGIGGTGPNGRGGVGVAGTSTAGGSGSAGDNASGGAAGAGATTSAAAVAGSPGTNLGGGVGAGGGGGGGSPLNAAGANGGSFGSSGGGSYNGGAAGLGAPGAIILTYTPVPVAAAASLGAQMGMAASARVIRRASARLQAQTAIARRWTPMDDPATVAFWHADDLANGNVDVGNYWVDRKAGISLQPIAGSTPPVKSGNAFNGVGGVTFDGVSSRLLGNNNMAALPAASLGAWLFASAAQNWPDSHFSVGTTVQAILFGYGSPGSGGYARLIEVNNASPGSSCFFDVHDGFGDVEDTRFVPNLGIHLYGGAFSTSLLTGRIDGNDTIPATAPTTVGPFPTPAQVVIGSRVASPVADRYWQGPTRHFIITADLTTTQRDRYEGYIAWDSGLQALLPSAHTYKNLPPLVLADARAVERAASALPINAAETAQARSGLVSSAAFPVASRIVSAIRRQILAAAPPLGIGASIVPAPKTTLSARPAAAGFSLAAAIAATPKAGRRAAVSFPAQAVAAVLVRPFRRAVVFMAVQTASTGGARLRAQGQIVLATKQALAGAPRRATAAAITLAATLAISTAPKSRRRAAAAVAVAASVADASRHAAVATTALGVEQRMVANRLRVAAKAQGILVVDADLPTPQTGLAAAVFAVFGVSASIGNSIKALIHLLGRPKMTGTKVQPNISGELEQ